MKTSVRMLIASFLVSSAACTGDGGGGGKGGSSGAGIAGAWNVVESDQLWEHFRTGSIEFMEFDEDGTGEAFGIHQGLFTTRGCARLLYAKSAPGLLLIDAPELVEPPGKGFVDERVAQVEYDRDGDSLVLTAEGESMTLSRVDEVPAAVRCERAVFENTFSLPMDAGYGSGIGFSGGSLVISSNNGDEVLINPSTGSFATLSLTGFVRSSQGNDLWMQNGYTLLERRTISDVLIDSVDTALMGIPELSLITSAWYGSGALWALGVDFTTFDRFSLGTIDSDGEPDTLLSITTEDDSEEPLAHSGFVVGDSLWLLADVMGPVLVELSATDFAYRRAIDLMATDDDWYSLHLDGTTMYLLRRTGDPAAPTAIDVLSTIPPNL